MSRLESFEGIYASGAGRKVDMSPIPEGSKGRGGDAAPSPRGDELTSFQLWKRQAHGYLHRITPRGEKSLCGVRGVPMARDGEQIDCPRCLEAGA